MIALTLGESEEVKKIINYTSHSIGISKTGKLQNWHELDLSEFIKELNKAIKSQNTTRAHVPLLTKKDAF